MLSNKINKETTFKKKKKNFIQQKFCIVREFHEHLFPIFQEFPGIFPTFREYSKLDRESYLIVLLNKLTN